MTSLVQLAPNGEVYFLALNQTDLVAAKSATWSAIPVKLTSTSTSTSTSTAPSTSTTTAANVGSDKGYHSLTKVKLAVAIVASILIVCLLFVAVWAVERSRARKAKEAETDDYEESVEGMKVVRW